MKKIAHFKSNFSYAGDIDIDELDGFQGTLGRLEEIISNLISIYGKEASIRIHNGCDDAYVIVNKEYKLGL